MYFPCDNAGARDTIVKTVSGDEMVNEPVEAGIMEETEQKRKEQRLIAYAEQTVLWEPAPPWSTSSPRVPLYSTDDMGVIWEHVLNTSKNIR